MKTFCTLVACLFAFLSFAQADTLKRKETFNITKSPPDTVAVNFQKFQIEPSIDRVIWQKHLESKLVSITDSALSKKIPQGIYTVHVKFAVETDGSLSNIEAMDNPGFGLTEEAKKIIASSPKWNPGIQNGKIIRIYRTQPVTFFVKSPAPGPEISKSKDVAVDDDETIFIKAEIEPSIDPYVWQRHQDKQIKKFLKATKGKQKIPEGTYRIYAVFLVEKNGTISDIQILNDPGFELADLAKTIFRTSPKWKPGKHNSKIVRAYKYEFIELDVFN